MKSRIIMALLLSLLFASLVVPLAGADDGSKALVKEMVQEPGDYSVGSSFHPIDRMDDMYQSLGRFHTCWFVRFS